MRRIGLIFVGGKALEVPYDDERYLKEAPQGFDIYCVDGELEKA